MLFITISSLPHLYLDIAPLLSDKTTCQVYQHFRLTAYLNFPSCEKSHVLKSIISASVRWSKDDNNSSIFLNDIYRPGKKSK